MFTDGPEKRKKLAANAAYAVFAAAAVYLAVKYAVPLVLPFLFAFVTSLPLRPIVDAAQDKLRIPRQITSLLCIFILVVFIFCLAFLFVDRFLYELRGLLDSLSDNSDRIAGFFAEKIRKLCSKLPFVKNTEEEKMISEMTGVGIDMLKNLSYKVPELLTSFLSALPDLFIGFLSYAVSLYYFCSLKKSVVGSAISFLPENRAKKAEKIYSSALRALSSVAKGYLLIILLTFIQLFIGFSVLKIEYAFALALLTSLIDVLPVLGVGTVLLPFSLIKFASGDPKTGIGLIIIFIVISIIRETLEPKLIGKTSGIHPLSAAVCLYVGFRLLGFAGLIIFPVAAVILKSVIEEKSGGHADCS